MKIFHNLLAFIAVAAMLAFSAFVPVLATPAMAAFGAAAFAVCDDPNSGYNHTGGFCEAVAANKSILGSGPPPLSCPDGEHVEHPVTPGPLVCVPDEEPV